MEVHYGFESFAGVPHPVVTVGSYDGVHGGHRAILARIARLARERGGQSVVVTFAPHPRTVLGTDEGLRLLNTPEEKAMLLAQAGIDHLIVAPFTEEFSRMSGEEYVRRLLVGKLRTETLVVGYNHRFGRDNEGDYRFLQRLHEELGFDIFEIPAQQIDSEKVSSTVIRRLIARGCMEHAARLLEHPYIFLAHTRDGSLLFSPEKIKLLPPAGIYPVTVAGAAHTLTIAPDRLLLHPAAQADAEGRLLVTFGPCGE